EAGLRLPGPAAREPLEPRAWPEWAELVPGVIMIYDFTHFTRAHRCVVAVIDVISKYWLEMNRTGFGSVLFASGGLDHDQHEAGVYLGVQAECSVDDGGSSAYGGVISVERGCSSP